MLNTECSCVTQDTPSSPDSVRTTDSTLHTYDIFGAWKARWGIGRMHFIISPGLYAANKPGPDDSVVVTANYKLSFDTLRSDLHGRPAWILVLDTNGINVWCAAGKGTFGTSELIQRIGQTSLANVVSHRTVVLPQLGAPGVSAHMVREQTGFRAVFGPVRSTDLNSFLDSGMKASPGMRRVRFSIYDRLVLIPMEIVQSLKYLSALAVCFMIISGFGSDGYVPNRIVSQGVPAVALVFLAGFSGTLITPLLLPWLPGRAFSIKGIWGGILIALLVMFTKAGSGMNLLTRISWFPIMIAISSFLSMNFTGATTFTSYSGVKKEVKYSLPVQGVLLATGIIMWIIGRFI